MRKQEWPGTLFLLSFVIRYDCLSKTLEHKLDENHRKFDALKKESTNVLSLKDN